MTKYFIYLLIPAMLFVPGPLQGQVNNQFFHEYNPVDSGCIKSLRFGIDLLGFQKNNEYFNDFVDGYSLFGYQFRPYLSLYPVAKVRVDGGIFLLRDFGGTEFRQAEPYFMFKYLSGNFSFLFGNLEGSLSHRMVEPVFDFERIIYRRNEQGLQAKWESERVFLDAWIDWERFIVQHKDTTQEIFSAGISSEYRLFSTGRLVLSLPFQATARHTGDPINITDRPVFTIYNSCIGIKTEFIPGSPSLFKSVRLEGYSTGYKLDDPNYLIPFYDGYGFMASLSADTRFGDLNITYWEGNEFYSPLGTPIYQSVSSTYARDHYTEDTRSLIIARSSLELKLADGIKMLLRFEPVYDLSNRRLDHAESLYLRLTTDWHLLKF
ncbi:MAG TPA: hypothetical protein VI583_10300 [Cyclobacteriaceae bacterium]|nr:hypothetical protein [Cyclobacteriaceae bacterium]